MNSLPILLATVCCRVEFPDYFMKNKIPAVWFGLCELLVTECTSISVENVKKKEDQNQYCAFI